MSVRIDTVAEVALLLDRGLISKAEARDLLALPALNGRKETKKA